MITKGPTGSKVFNWFVCDTNTRWVENSGELGVARKECKDFDRQRKKYRIASEREQKEVCVITYFLKFFVVFLAGLWFIYDRYKSLFAKVPNNLYRHLVLSDLKEVASHLPPVSVCFILVN